MLIKARTMVRAILLDRTHMGNDHYWERHVAAVKSPIKIETAVIGLIYSIAEYIDRFPYPSCDHGDICCDYLASEYLEPMISAVGYLLNYDIGRLDGGKVSETLSYLRMCLQVGSNPVGTMPNDSDIKRFARIMWECWVKDNAPK